MSSVAIRSVRFLERVYGFIDRVARLEADGPDGREAKELASVAWAYLQIATRSRDKRRLKRKIIVARRARVAT